MKKLTYLFLLTDRLKTNLRNLGFKGAFIVAFLDGKQISTKEALNLQNKLK